MTAQRGQRGGSASNIDDTSHDIQDAPDNFSTHESLSPGSNGSDAPRVAIHGNDEVFPELPYHQPQMRSAIVALDENMKWIEDCLDSSDYAMLPEQVRDRAQTALTESSQQFKTHHVAIVGRTGTGTSNARPDTLHSNP